MSTMLVTRLHKTKKTKDGKLPIVLQITWNRNVRRKRLGLSALPEQWDFTNHEFKKGVHGRRERNKELEDIEERANAIYKKHFTDRPFSYKEFLDLFEEKPVDQVKVSEFCMQVSDQFLKTDQANSAYYYRYVGKAVLKVSPKDITFSEFNEDWLRKFEEHYQSRGVKCFNYMVHLRSIFNKAVQKRIADFKKNPFKNLYTNPYGYDFSRLKKSKISQTRKDRIKDLSREQLIDSIQATIPYRGKVLGYMVFLLLQFWS